MRSNKFANIVQIIITSTVTFLSFRILLSSITLSNFGAVAMVLTLANLGRMLEVGIGASLTKNTAEKNILDQKIYLSELIESVMISTFLLLLTGSLFIFGFAPNYLKWFVDPSQHADILKYLPYGLLSVGLSVISSLTAGVLDGLQLMVARAKIAIVSNLLSLTLVYILIPRFGTIGYFVAQIVQWFFYLSITFLLVRKYLPLIPLVPHKLRLPIIRPLYSYGSHIQYGNTTSLIIDIATKSLLSKYSSLAFVGLFDLAQRIILQFRNILVATNQVIIPRLIELKIKNIYLIDAFFQPQVRNNLKHSLIFFTLLSIWSVPVSSSFLSALDMNFIIIYHLLLATWTVNLCSLPYYFLNQALDYQSNNSKAFTLAFSLTLLFAFVFRAQGYLTTCLSLLIGQMSYSLYLMFINKLKGNNRFVFGLIRAMLKTYTLPSLVLCFISLYTSTSSFYQTNLLLCIFISCIFSIAYLMYIYSLEKKFISLAL